MEVEEKVSVINRTNERFRVKVIVEEEYKTYNLYANDFRVYEFRQLPVKREYKIILEKEDDSGLL